jgi:hypothetical protein
MGRWVIGVTTTAISILISVHAALTQPRKDDQRSVYDTFRELIKPSAETTVDEQVTARIKRHMANLLYPVDMSSFIAPDKDERFREMIMTLQKRMGVPATGVLTMGEFDRMAEASRNLEAPVVTPFSGKFVSMSDDDGGTVIAAGTGAMADIAAPINRVHILCTKANRICEFRGAEFDLKTHMVDLVDGVFYQLATWGPNRITAIREHPCGTATLSIDVKAEEVTIVTAPHADVAACNYFGNRPDAWTLVDGFPVAWQLNQDTITRARALVYEPALKYLAPLRK